jgi:hypothetical protein
MLINMIRAIAAFLMIGSMSAAAQEHAGHGGPSQPTPGVLDRVRPQEASGTAWQPADTPMSGFHFRYQGWDFMAHAAIFAGIDWQEGDRGDNAMISTNWIMLMGRHPLGPGEISLRGMLTLEPWTVEDRGYPLLLQSGETIHDVPIHDRQHPHDLFMELSASYGVPLGGRASAFVYAGLPGEPAFGPPAFMHRASIMDSPEAPISHHWLDSTHISFGVVTAGLILGDFKLEGSRFNGREPDQHRWNIETGALDSTAFRLSWNPTASLSLQASWAHLVGPEQLEPADDSIHWSASALYTERLSGDDWWSATLAWGRRDGDDALALESAVGLGLWTLFARAEWTENDELTGGHHGPAYDVGKVSLGAIRDVRVAPHVRLGLGGLYALNFVPAPLEPLYGGDPHGAMLFLRLRID